MLDSLRKGGASTVAKGLAVLLILSFVGWGVSDYFAPGVQGTAVAVVGDTQIGSYEFNTAYTREVNRLSARLGSRIDPDQARAMGIAQSVLARLLNGALIDRAASDLDLVVSDDIVRRAIRDNPAFRNDLGTFDAEVFEARLRNAGYTEARYVAGLRGDIAREFLVDSVRHATAAPRAVVDALFERRAERRLAEIVRIPHARFGDVGEPDPATLAAFHRDNAALFTAPETRTVSVVVLRAADLAGEIAVPEESIDEAVADRADEFREPERRVLRQAVFPDEAAARAARQRIASGDDEGLGADALDLGTVSRDELLPELADAVFALGAGETSGPLQSALGWHLIEVVDVLPETTPPAATVRARLRDEIAAEMAVDALFDLANRLEDTLAGGASLDDAARSVGVEPRRAGPFDAGGRGTSGEPAADLEPGMVEAAFETEEGQESPLTEVGTDAYFLLRVDGVAPAALSPLEAVREDVVEAWRAERRAERALAEAEAMARDFGAGANLAAAAAERGLIVATAGPFFRTGQGAPDDMPPDLVSALFAAAPGATSASQGDRAAFFARLAEVLPADRVAARGARDALGRDVAAGIANDLVAQLTAAMRARHDVSVNQTVLEQSY